MNYPKVGELVAKDIRAAEVLRNYGIDFCCGGGKTLDKAAEKKGLNPDEVLSSIVEHLSSTESSGINFNEMKLSNLIDHIVNKHHSYVRNSIDFIEPLLSKLIRVHGKKHPELYEIGDLFLKSVNELNSHMKKEEKILFPYVKALESKNFDEINYEVGSVRNPIIVMEQEHENEGSRFRKMAELADNFKPPEDACNTYILTYFKLAEFKKDLEEHVHLENNILFPKAIKLEEKMNKVN